MKTYACGSGIEEFQLVVGFKVALNKNDKGIANLEFGIGDYYKD